MSTPISLARGLAVVLALSAAGCTSRTGDPPAGPPRALGSACDALAPEAGADPGRFAAHFPVARGGAVLVVRGAPGPLAALIEGAGLADVRIVPCPEEHVVLFIPGLDRRGVAELSRMLLASGDVPAVRERAVFGPDGALAR